MRDEKSLPQRTASEHKIEEKRSSLGKKIKYSSRNVFS